MIDPPELRSSSLRESSTRRNIDEICRLELDALRKRTLPERLGDAIASQAGRMWFIATHAVWFSIWVPLNLTGLFGIPPFDPYPFALLTMIVSLESIFLSLFILMSQNSSNRQADERNHLDLQINLLSEDENTQMLKMLKALCVHHGLKIGADPDIMELTKRTEPAELLEELKEKLPPA